MRVRFLIVLVAVLAGLWSVSVIAAETDQSTNQAGVDNGHGTSMADCCVGRVGDANGIGGDEPTIGDISAMIDAIFITGTCDGILNCLTEADLNQSGGANPTCNDITIGDISILIDYVFISGQENMDLLPCGGTMSPGARMQTMAAVNQVCDSLAGDPLFNSKLLTYLQSRPEFEDSGLSESSSNVWARFTDGVLLIFSGNRAGATTGSASDLTDSFPSVQTQQYSSGRGGQPQPGNALSPEAYLTGLPKRSSVRMLNTLGAWFRPITGTLGSWLSSQGYVVGNRDETVTGLRNVGGDGVFFFSTHGGDGRARGSNGAVVVYGLWTSTIADSTNLGPYLQDLLTGRLCLQDGPIDLDPQGRQIWQLHYGITPKFVSYYWRNFAEDAMVYIDACGSDGAAAQELKAAIMAKNASVYFGWTHVVASDASNLVAKFMFDRLLGANLAPPLEDPAQRPFDYEDVYNDLANRGLNVHTSTDPGSTTTFQYTAGPGAFGLLAPSIREFFIDEANDKIYVLGQFGDDPGPDMRRVTVNGEELPVDTWDGLMIVANIPNSGSGSAGPLVVETRVPVDDGGLVPLIYRKSNTVNISEWKGQFRYTEVNAGALHLYITMNLHLRTDLQPYRRMPHEAPLDTVRSFDGADDSYGSIAASGTLSEPINEAMTLIQTWSGGRNLPGTWDNSDPNANFGVWGNASAIGHWMKLLLFPHALDGYTYTFTVTGDGGYTDSYTTEAVIYSGLYDHPESMSFDLVLDSHWNISAGARTLTIPTSSSMLNPCCTDFRIEWDQITCSFPPDLATPQAPPNQDGPTPTATVSSSR